MSRNFQYQERKHQVANWISFSKIVLLFEKNNICFCFGVELSNIALKK